ncbi:MAG: c-type cytochrome, partial [Gammaproteobacteria bacterium]
MKKLLMIALSGAVLAMSGSAFAGDAEKGKAKAAACAACHGADGNSANPEWPNLAGQGAKYITAQLKAFKSGERKNALMAGQAAPLSDEDMENLGAYFATLTPKVGETDPKFIEQGKAIYMGGDAERMVSACLACHGPSGKGNPAASYPALSGQHAKYTMIQLQAFASG